MSAFRTATLMRTVATMARSTVAPRALYRMPNVRAFAVKVGETRYTKDHEWVTVTKADEATIGITDFAQSALGDVVFIELPENDAKFTPGEAFGSVESVKAVSSVYAPVSLTITESNQALKDDNSLINTSAEKDGWMIKVKLNSPDQLDQLMDKAAYEELLASQKH